MIIQWKWQIDSRWDLVDRGPEELYRRRYITLYRRQWPKKTTPKKKKCKEVKWLSEEALQIAEERREMKGKGERERYTQWNTQFQRKARRDKKAFFNEQCKEIVENKRRRKTSDLLGKQEISMEHFTQAWAWNRRETVKNLAETKEIKKRWQDYKES